MARKRAAILISGRGSNMSALIEAARDPGYPAQIAGVICDRPGAAGLDIAARAGIPTRVIAAADHPSRDAHDAAVEAAIAELGAEIVCLAGYMRLLTPDFVDRLQGRIVNIHPALLPLFKGLDTHARALAEGVKVHGCTVHFVTAGMDAGPIVAQAAVPVLPHDTEATLAERVLAAEHRLYPLALGLLAQGKVRMQEGRAVFSRLPEGDASAAIVISPPPAPGEVDLEALARFTP